jgi:hypothetical protein|nr:MAG TPA: hypothetical protein [Caudoviricetes sp.]
MAIGKLHKKNELYVRFHQADALNPENGEKIDISFSGITTFIEYKGRLVSWDIQEMIREAIDIIENELSKEN